MKVFSMLFLASLPTALPVSSQVNAFVHTINPARQQQQPVGNSVSSGQSGPSDEVRSGGASGDVASSVVDQPLQEEVCRFDLAYILCTFYKFTNFGEFIGENFKLLYFIK